MIVILLVVITLVYKPAKLKKTGMESSYPTISRKDERDQCIRSKQSTGTYMSLQTGMVDNSYVKHFTDGRDYLSFSQVSADTHVKEIPLFRSLTPDALSNNTAVTLQTLLIWETLGIDCSQVNIFVNRKELELSPIITKPVIDKYNIR